MKISDALFSKATKAVLAHLFAHPDGVHLRALMAATGLGSASAQRELGKLSEAGILRREEVGKVVLYKPDPACPVYDELASLMRKTEGAPNIVQDALQPFADRIERAFIYGSVARGSDSARSDIDLLVVSAKLGSADLYPILLEVERKLGRKVSLAVYRPAEFKRKLDQNNHFLASVLNGPVIELLDGSHGH